MAPWAKLGTHSCPGTCWNHIHVAEREINLIINTLHATLEPARQDRHHHTTQRVRQRREVREREEKKRKVKRRAELRGASKVKEDKKTNTLIR